MTDPDGGAASIPRIESGGQAQNAEQHGGAGVSPGPFVRAGRRTPGPPLWIPFGKLFQIAESRIPRPLVHPDPTARSRRCEAIL